MLGLKPEETWTFTPQELESLARENRRAYIRDAIDRRYETAIICSFQYNSTNPKVPKSPDAIYKQMEIKDPEEQEKVTGPRRVYKGSMKSRYEQHIKWLEEQKKHGDNK